ncbi:hypothetical protein Emed_002969 [Eimeria media]
MVATLCPVDAPETGCGDPTTGDGAARSVRLSRLIQSPPKLRRLTLFSPPAPEKTGTFAKQQLLADGPPTPEIQLSHIPLILLCMFVCSDASTCFEYGVDYTGYDILTLSGVSNPTLCFESCGQSADCGFWSYDAETRICYLKSEAALLGRTAKENIISGPKSCLTGTQCFSENTDYVGYDLKRIEGADVASAKACQELCIAEPQCAFFSYKKSNKGCYLKSAAAPVGKTIDEDVVSGPRECSADQGAGEGGNDQSEQPKPDAPSVPEAPDNEINDFPDSPERSCAKGSVEYRGHDVAVTKNVRSVAYCQRLCSSNYACFFWTYDNTRQICYQKDEYASEFRMSDSTTLGKVSGAKDCIPVTPGCQLLDTTFLGTVVKQLKKIATYEACQQNCQNEAKCEFFTYDTRSMLCLLREAAPYGFVSDVTTAGSIAGPKFCPNDDLCIEQADYVGYDLESIEDGSVTSATQCRSICRKTEGCEFFTFVRSTGNCYLKTEGALAGKSNSLATLGKFSGPKNCFLHSGNVEFNSAYLSTTAATAKNVTSYKDCEQRCEKTTDCKRWSYLKDSQTCIIVTKSDIAKRVSLSGAMSGTLPSPAKNTNEEDCLMMGVKYKNKEMATVSAEDVNECHYECVNANYCTAFTFEQGIGCTLYDEEPELLSKSSAVYATAVSGLAKCGDDFEGEADTCYEDETIEGASFYVFSDSACAAKCAELSTCAFWTYSPKERSENCTLHREGAHKETDCPGSRSGERGVQAATYDFSYFDAASATVQQADTADACRAESVKQGLPYWSYFKESKECKLHGHGSHIRQAHFHAMCGTAADPLSVDLL